ncbi:MAG TPA: UDP-3-O-(3-hydroxymyristoyl)glucosamine N-acyltransferase [Anaeromyxobacteraceae bacterium]|nr:UDP-3-O-(3-hydroxymyristoyl)glucosamine N-acyltransferase [Anaeromyxobacteraceae bacterium]
MDFLLSELAARVGGEVQGDGALRVERVAPLEEAGPADLSFFANPRYRAAFEASRAGAVVLEPDVAAPAGRTVLRVKNAYLAFARISTLFHPPRESAPEIAPQAAVHPSAHVHPSAQVMPFACVGPGVEVGARTVLFPGVVLGAEARVGDDCVLYANVNVRERCVVGHRCILQPGVVIGADGFGFAYDPEGEGGSGPRHYKVPQAGNVIVEDDVEIGANSCVDRATLGSTVVGRGSKIDNLVQLAHNVQVGPLSIVCAQVGVSGSTRLGQGVVLAGQVGLAGHLHVGDRATLLAQSGVMNDVPAGETWGGYPARPQRRWLRDEAQLRRLDELSKRVRALEKAAGPADQPENE